MTHAHAHALAHGSPALWIGLGLLLVAGLLLADRRRAWHRSVFALALLVAVFGFESAVHSVHHLSDPLAADSCTLLSGSKHVDTASPAVPDAGGPLWTAASAAAHRWRPRSTAQKRSDVRRPRSSRPLCRLATRRRSIPKERVARRLFTAGDRGGHFHGMHAARSLSRRHRRPAHERHRSVGPRDDRPAVLPGDARHRRPVRGGRAVAADRLLHAVPAVGGWPRVSPDGHQRRSSPSA